MGTTRQSLSNRLRQGYEARGKKGYHGYKWKKFRNVDMVVWFFPDKDSLFVEAVEAEIVYLIRKKTKKWPTHQTEIHFNNSSKIANRTAKYIYASTKKL